MADDLKDFDEIDRKVRLERDPAFANHLPLGHIESVLGRAGSDIPLGGKYGNPLRTFMVVRNPWARMVSLYYHRLRKLHLSYEGKPRNTPEDIRVAKQGFIPWLLTTPSRGDYVLTRVPQSYWGKDESGEFAVKCVLRQENLTADWLDMLEDWGLPYTKLNRVNVGSGHSKEYRKEYDEQAYLHVWQHFKEDIDRFGYAF
jgi:hypothetical protein